MGNFCPLPPTPAPYESCIQVRGRVNTKDDDRDAIFETPPREESLGGRMWGFFDFEAWVERMGSEFRRGECTHRPLSSSFLGLPYRILKFFAQDKGTA